MKQRDGNRNLHFPDEALREAWLLRNNRASMSHPMHIHGFQFRVLERRDSPAQVKALATRNNGLLPQDYGLLDTVPVWPGESVRFALDFSHPFSGDQIYMFHCHNLEHEDTGMTMSFLVKDKAMLSNLQPLQKVNFELTYDGRTYMITKIK